MRSWPGSWPVSPTPSGCGSSATGAPRSPGRSPARGSPHPERGRVERARRAGITGAITRARAGDIALVAGKGHEDYQEVAGVKHPFDAVRVARQALHALAAGEVAR